MEQNKKNQIEEMARIIGGCHTTPNCKTCDEKSGIATCYNKRGAERLYNAGYRKCKDKVVLTREEYDEVLARPLNAMGDLVISKTTKENKKDENL